MIIKRTDETIRRENLALGFPSALFSPFLRSTWSLCPNVHIRCCQKHNTANLSQRERKCTALSKQSAIYEETQNPADTENVIVGPTASAASSIGLNGVVRSASAPGAAAVVNGRRNKSAATAAVLGRAPRQERVQGVLRVRVPRRQRRQESSQNCPASRYVLSTFSMCPSFMGRSQVRSPPHFNVLF